MKISVKTRIGIEDAEEFEDLQKVFQRYPFAEVIVHPRVRSDFYKNQPDASGFGAFLKESVNRSATMEIFLRYRMQQS